MKISGILKPFFQALIAKITLKLFYYEGQYDSGSVRL